MSAAPNPSDELPRLLSGLADGTLDAADEERLAELLQSDPAARASYYSHAMLAALLRREGRRAAAQRDSSRHAPRDDAQTLTRSVRIAVPACRLRPWLMVLAASILLGLLLSVGEATGITRFIPTMIRIVTGEGALVIEVDDPSVSVQLDGADITISGAGIHELRLRPGTHRFVATKDGQSLREETVTIERGGRRVVKVTRQPLAAATQAGQPEQQPKGPPALSAEAGKATGALGFESPFRQKRVLIILPSQDFYYPDYIPVRNILIRADVKVLVASPTADAAQPTPGNPGHVRVVPDLVLASVNGADYDAIYFCGGKGVEEFIGSGPYAADARRVIGEALAAKKYVTALSTGPLVLADAGLLAGLRATCYQFEDGVFIKRLTDAGAIWVDEPAVVSGQIITGRDPAHTREFSRALLQQLGVPADAWPQ